jgi:hypothetical protein
MWSTRTERVSKGGIFSLYLEERQLRFSDALRGWQDDGSFRAFFIALLADAPFSAFRWETPPITTATADQPFEFALLDSPELVTHPDPHAFAEHLDNPACNEDVISFRNLGNDAILVVPRPVSSLSAYGHLAAFVRNAPKSQNHALWMLVGQLMQQTLGSSPIWLSTAGAGVPWLHVRLDQRPKYYEHAPYRERVAGR